MAAIKRPRETRNGRFWMLIELKKSCIGESDAGNQTPLTATKPRNARPQRGFPVRIMGFSCTYHDTETNSDTF